jgi:fatty acid desaturase
MKLFNDDRPWELSPKPFALFIVALMAMLGAAGLIFYRGADAAPWWVWCVLTGSIVALIVASAWLVHEKEDLEDAETQEFGEGGRP